MDGERREFRNLGDLTAHLVASGRFHDQIIIAENYTKADLIRDLIRIRGVDIESDMA